MSTKAGEQFLAMAIHRFEITLTALQVKMFICDGDSLELHSALVSSDSGYHSLRNFCNTSIEVCDVRGIQYLGFDLAIIAEVHNLPLPLPRKCIRDFVDTTNLSCLP